MIKGRRDTSVSVISIESDPIAFYCFPIKREDERVISENREQFAQAVSRRDPDCLDRLNESTISTLPLDLREKAHSLKEKVGALLLNDSNGRRFIVAPGPEQGLGRGEEWLF